MENHDFLRPERIRLTFPVRNKQAGDKWSTATDAKERDTRLDSILTVGIEFGIRLATMERGHDWLEDRGPQKQEEQTLNSN